MKVVINGKYAQYTVYDKCIKVMGSYFNSVDEIERYRYFRVCNGLKAIDNILNEAIKIIEKCTGRGVRNEFI